MIVLSVRLLLIVLVPISVFTMGRHYRSFHYMLIMGASRRTYSLSQDIWGWLWFSCEIEHYGKGLISIFEEFFASIKKISILAGRLGTRLSFYGF